VQVSTARAAATEGDQMVPDSIHVLVRDGGTFLGYSWAETEKYRADIAQRAKAADDWYGDENDPFARPPEPPMILEGVTVAFVDWCRSLGLTTIEQGRAMLDWCQRHRVQREARNDTPIGQISPRYPTYHVVRFDSAYVDIEQFQKMAQTTADKIRLQD
jgi:hypothetical protein